MATRKRQITSLSPFKNTNASTLSLFAADVEKYTGQTFPRCKVILLCGLQCSYFHLFQVSTWQRHFLNFFFPSPPRKGNSCQQQSQKHAVPVIFCFQMKWNVFGEPRGMLMRQVQWRWTHRGSTLALALAALRAEHGSAAGEVP